MLGVYNPGYGRGGMLGVYNPGYEGERGLCADILPLSHGLREASAQTACLSPMVCR